jgi:hypothetical protein
MRLPSRRGLGSKQSFREGYTGSVLKTAKFVKKHGKIAGEFWVGMVDCGILWMSRKKSGNHYKIYIKISTQTA